MLICGYDRNNNSENVARYSVYHIVVYNSICWAITVINLGVDVWVD